MTTMRSMLLLAALAACPQTPGTGLRAQADPQARAAAPTPPNVTMTFTGGTLAEFLVQVRRLDQRINIVASDIARDVEVPAITLLDAPVAAALDAVTSVLPPDFKARATTATGSGGNPVHVIQIEARSRRGEAAESIVKVFPLATLTQALPDDPQQTPIALPARTVLSAIEAGTRVLATQPELRYHEESQLLFVRGSAEEVTLVRDVLANLEQQQGQLRSQLRAVRSQRAAPGGAGAETQPDAGHRDR